MMGAAEKAQAYAQQPEARVERVAAQAVLLLRRPLVYFKQWDEPSINAIRWVSELIGFAGGDDIFPDWGLAPLRRDRIVADRAEILARAADIITRSR